MGVDASALLVTVAPTGAETSKEDCPQLPTTLEELIETAQACEQAGSVDGADDLPVDGHRCAKNSLNDGTHREIFLHRWVARIDPGAVILARWPACPTR